MDTLNDSAKVTAPDTAKITYSPPSTGAAQSVGFTPPLPLRRPQVGEVVLFNYMGREIPAFVSTVWSETLVNLIAFAEFQGPITFTSVPKGQAGVVSTWRYAVEYTTTLNYPA